jgi:hypothetical protein
MGQLAGARARAAMHFSLLGVASVHNMKFIEFQQQHLA